MATWHGDAAPPAAGQLTPDSFMSGQQQATPPAGTPLPGFSGPPADLKNPAIRLPSAAEAHRLAVDEAKQYVDQLVGRPAQAPIPAALQPDRQATALPQPVQVGSPRIKLPPEPGGFINPQLTRPTSDVLQPGKPTYGQGVEALLSGKFKEAHEILSQPPEFVSKLVDELNRFLVGPFQFHAAVAKTAAGLASPENAAIAGATGGLGAAAESGSALMRAAAQTLNAGLSTYFATQAGKSLAQQSPELVKAVKAGDLNGIASSLGYMSADAMLIHLAGEHASESAGEAAGAAGELADKFRTGGKYGQARSTKAEVVPDYSKLSDDQLVGEYNRANAKGQQTTKADIAREIVMRQAVGKHKRLGPATEAAEPVDVAATAETPGTAATGTELNPDAFMEMVNGLGEKPGGEPSGKAGETPGEPPIASVSEQNGETPAKAPLPKMNPAMQAAHDQATAMVAEAEKDGDPFRVAAARRHVEFIEDLVRASQYKSPPPKHTAESLVDEYTSRGLQPSPKTVATPEEVRAGAELAIEQHNAENPPPEPAGVNYRRVVWKGDGWYVRSIAAGQEDGGPYPSQVAATRALLEEHAGTPLGQVIDINAEKPTEEKHARIESPSAAGADNREANDEAAEAAGAADQPERSGGAQPGNAARKAGREAVGGEPQALVRIDAADADLSQEKPHGLYFTIGDQSPHQDAGDTRYEAEATGKRTLDVQPARIEHSRFKGRGLSGSGEISAGVGALRQLVPADEFDRLRSAPRAELERELADKFPGPDYGKYHDTYELLEAYGAQMARAAGYDSLRLEDKESPQFSEYVALHPKAFRLKPREAAGPKPGTVADLPVSSIRADPARFQFKANTGQGGAGEELRSVEKFDPEMAGVVAVWHDPADGRTYIVNGHNRLALAQRTGASKITARYLDAKSAQEARLKGALINIAEGRGESTDAAKVFRDLGAGEEELRNRGISIKGKIASEGLALAKLDPHLFGRVIAGELPAARGAVIGAGLPEHADQRALYDLIQKAEKAGKRPTNDQIEEMIRLAKSGPQKTETQESLFGAEEVTRSLIAEKAEVSDYIRKQLAGEKRIFSSVGNEAVAGKLSERGNVIKAGENKAVAEQAAQALAIYDKLSGRSGPVSDVLGRAATELAEGKDATKTKQTAYLRIRQALAAELRAAEPGVRRAEGLGGEGPLQAGEGQLDSSGSQGPLNSVRSALDVRRRLAGPPYRPGSNLARIADESRAYVSTAGTPRRPVVFVNRQAMALIQSAGFRTGGQHVYGSTLPQGNQENLVRQLQGALPKLASQPARQRAVADLLAAIEKARGRNPGRPLVVVQAGPEMWPKDIQEALQEELDHAVQLETTGELYANHVGPDGERRILDRPAGVKATASLRAGGYANAPDPVMVLEIGVRLMRPGRFAEMGLTAQEAEDLGVEYQKALENRHGPDKVAPVVDRVYSAFGGQLRGRNKRGEAAVEFGRRGGKGNAARPERNLPDTGRGGLSRRLAKGAGDQGSLFNTRREVDNGSLFGDSFDVDAQREAEASGQRQLTGDQLTAEFQTEISRPKGLKRGKPAAQTSLFEPTPEDPQGSLFSMGNRGSVPINTATLGLAKLYSEDIRPAIAAAAKLVVESKDDILRMLAPGARGPRAAGTHAELRYTAAELQRRADRARTALEAASKALRKLPLADRYAFIDRIEHRAPQPTLELQAIGDLMRQMLDAARDEVQQLGTGKLQKFYENYFPHAWADPKKAQIAIASMLARKPFEGKKSFLKKRTLVTFADGLAAGLTPVSEDPVELVLTKLGEMQRYIMAHHALDAEKAAGRAKYVDARKGKAPKGWEKIDDPIATVYGPSIQQITEYPNEGLWNGLHQVAAALGIRHERGFTNLRGAVGRANQASGRVQTMHGSAEDVLAHEIGHQIDWRAGSGRRFITDYPDAGTAARLKTANATLRDPASTPADRKAARAELKTLRPAIARRKEFARQLRALADLRGGRPEYTHKREEKMAQLAEMWVGARELFARTAPEVFKEWKQFLNDNPKLHALRDIEGNTEVTPIAQPYDVGGLVIRGHWWAPKESALLFNNYLAPGLRSKSGLFRAYTATGNVLLQFQLGWSAFHGTFVSLEAMTSRFALGLYQANHGAPGKGLTSMALGLTPVPPFQNYAAGKKIQKAWDRPGSQTPLIEQMADAVVEAGGRGHFEHVLQTRMTDRMLDALRAGNVWGALGRAPFAATEQVARPIMEFLVPRMKLGAFAKMAQFELERLGPGATPEQVRLALGKAWDSIDNRFGQLVYDNLAWHRIVKDLAQASVRTVGWNVGDIREMGGGALDALKAAKGIPSARRFEISHRLSYLLALPVVIGLYGAITNWLLSGEAPQELRDYYYPRDGEGGRVSMPSYVKEVISAGHDPMGWAKGKLHPLLTLIADIADNKDYFGRPITKEDQDFMERQLARLKYAASLAEPISIQGLEKSQGRSMKENVLPFVGFPRAPKYITGGGAAASNGAAAEDELLKDPVRSRRGAVASETAGESDPLLTTPKRKRAGR